MSSKCPKTWTNLYEHGQRLDTVCPQQKSICPKTWPEVGHVLKMSYTVMRLDMSSKCP